MSWTQVSEDLPPEGKIVLTYSEVYGSYFLAKWTAPRGWLDQDDDDLKIVTHWCAIELPLTFPITSKPDEEAAKKYGMKVARTLFS